MGLFLCFYFIVDGSSVFMVTLAFWLYTHDLLCSLHPVPLSLLGIVGRRKHASRESSYKGFCLLEMNAYLH